MTIGHSRLLSASDDTSIKKICTQVNTNFGYVMQPLTPDLYFTHTQVGDSDTDDIQTLTMTKPWAAGTEVNNGILGGFRLLIDGKTTNNFGAGPSAAYAQSLLTQAGITGITVTGGSLPNTPLVFTTSNTAQPQFEIVSNTLKYPNQGKWVPTINLIEYYEVISNSIYTQSALWSGQAVYPDKTVSSGTVTFRISTYTGNVTLQPVPFNCTAQQLLDAIAAASSSTQLNVASYEVYGGPWPRPLVLQFKNTLQFASNYRLSVLTNSLNNGAVPQIFPTGKQLLVSYSPAYKKHIVVRPGYV